MNGQDPINGGVCILAGLTFLLRWGNHLETLLPCHHCCHLLPPEQGFPLDSSCGCSSWNQRGSYQSKILPTCWAPLMSCGIRRKFYPLLAYFYRSSKATRGQGKQHAVTNRCTSKTYRPWYQSPQPWLCCLETTKKIVDGSLPPAACLGIRDASWHRTTTPFRYQHHGEGQHCNPHWPEKTGPWIGHRLRDLHWN